MNKTLIATAALALLGSGLARAQTTTTVPVTVLPDASGTRAGTHAPMTTVPAPQVVTEANRLGHAWCSVLEPTRPSGRVQGSQRGA